MKISHPQTGHVEDCDGLIHSVTNADGALIGLRECDCPWHNGRPNPPAAQTGN
jgi:hypothetical protein